MGEHDNPLSLGPTGVAAAVYGNGYQYTDNLLALEAASSGGHVQELYTSEALYSRQKGWSSPCIQYMQWPRSNSEFSHMIFDAV